MDIQTLVEKYLNGDLNKTEVQDFEKQMHSNQALAEELQLQQDMRQYLLRKDKKEAFKNKLGAISNDYFSEQPTTEKKIPSQNSKRKRLWLMAAASAAAIALLFYISRPGQNMYEQFAVHQELQLTEKSGTQKAVLRDLESHFNSKKYAAALSITSQLLKNHPEDLEIQVVNSICLIELNQTEKARQRLESIAASQSAFKAEAQWYLALSYLREGALEKTKLALQKINKTDTFWYQKAMRLSAEL